MFAKKIRQRRFYAIFCIEHFKILFYFIYGHSNICSEFAGISLTRVCRGKKPRKSKNPPKSLTYPIVCHFKDFLFSVAIFAFNWRFFSWHFFIIACIVFMLEWIGHQKMGWIFCHGSFKGFFFVLLIFRLDFGKQKRPFDYFCSFFNENFLAINFYVLRIMTMSILNGNFNFGI